MKENLSVTLNIPGTLSAQGIHEPLSHQLHSIYTLTLTVVSRTTIRATHCIMSNRVSTVPALLFAYHHHSLLTALPVTGFLH
jgi:hypothetical protein